MIKTTFTRQELYELVWSEPLIQIAKRYSITDNGIRKKCKSLDIPLPDSGYWQKIKYNKPVKKLELNQNYTGTTQITLNTIDDELDSNSPKFQIEALVKSYKNLDQSLFKVPEHLNKPDKLIVDKQELIKASKKRDYYYHRPSNYQGSLDITTEEENLPRALRLFNSIIKLLQYRNHEVIINSFKTYAVIFGERIEIALREKMRAETTTGEIWNSKKYSPTGKLIFRISRIHLKEIEDGKVPLEDNLPLIIAHLEYRGQQEKEFSIQCEINRIERERIRLLEQEQKARKDKEIKKFHELLLESNAWHQSVILNQYIEEVERRALIEESITEEQKEWLAWAKEKSEWFNPFIKKEDVILGNQERNSFYANLIQAWEIVER